MKCQHIVLVAFTSAVLAAIVASPSFSATTVSTSSNLTHNFFGFSSVGETFTAPTDNILDSFSATFVDTQDPLTFSLFSWNGSSTTGSALYTSGPLTGSTAGGIATFSFTGINATLTTGNTYAAILTDGSSFYYVKTAHDPSIDPYTGGQMIAGLGPGLFTILDNQPIFKYEDMAFTAKFSGRPSGVPEPGAPLTLGVFALGLTAIMLRARKTNSKAA
ncbi:MAG: hypothetical protein JWQ02_237 [Capsulimonas sp.]|jgi:hypothetical protein|nr:hypothetical protein [Capsulimonas sp.]